MDVVSQLVFSCPSQGNRLSLDTAICSFSSIILEFIGVSVFVGLVPVVTSSDKEILGKITLQEEISLFVLVSSQQLKISHFSGVMPKVVSSMNVVIDLEVNPLSNFFLAIIGPLEANIEPDLKRTKLRRGVVKASNTLVELFLWFVHA